MDQISFGKYFHRSRSIVVDPVVVDFQDFKLGHEINGPHLAYWAEGDYFAAFDAGFKRTGKREFESDGIKGLAAPDALGEFFGYGKGIERHDFLRIQDIGPMLFSPRQFR